MCQMHALLVHAVHLSYECGYACTIYGCSINTEHVPTLQPHVTTFVTTFVSMAKQVMRVIVARLDLNWGA